MELKLKITTRNLRKRALLSAVLTKMVRNTFFTVLFQEDGTPNVPKEVNGRMNAYGTGKFNLMDEYLWMAKTNGTIEVIPVDRILGIKHNGIITTINGNASSKYDRTTHTLKLI
jgi:hypothetical protein